MALLKRFKRDPRNLVGPDVARAPLRTIDVSGTKVSFRGPYQTAMIPLFGGSDSFDIERDVEPSVYNPCNAHARIFSSGWTLNDRSVWGEAYGSVCADIGIGRTDFKSPHKSFLLLETFKKWLCDDLEASYGRWNREKWENRDHYANPITPERNFWRYPKNNDDIRTEILNGIEWCKYETHQPGQPPYFYFDTAIGHRHSLSFSFSASAYGGLDYFSPEHNVKQASEALIREIMSTVTIQLSPQAQREFDEVANRTTSKTLKDGTG